jgi:hypothetical protein
MDMSAVGPYSNHATLAKLDGRSKEARLMKSLRTELIAHVGGKPSVAQTILIEQATKLQLRIAMMDREGTGTGMSERRQVEYLAWTGSLTRLLRDLGLEAASPPKPRWQPPASAQPGAIWGRPHWPAHGRRSGAHPGSPDVAEEAAAVEHFMAGGNHRLGGLDVPVNNAGFPVATPSDRPDIADFDRVLAVNLRGDGWAPAPPFATS